MSYNEILNLDVGGTKFKTSRQTLMREPASLLGRMFDIDSPLQPAAMQDGAYFLDRDPKKFEIILNYLREDELSQLTKTDLINLMIEARYFQLTKLEAEIKSRLDKIDVYKFMYRDDCYEVAKSYFSNIPLSAIVNVMSKGQEMKDAFYCLDNLIKPVSDNDIIFFNNQEEPIKDLQDVILSTRNHLLLRYKYIIPKATYINVNICGWVFMVRTEVALKDSKSDFYRCWNLTDEHKRWCCPWLNLDADSNYEPLFVCICGGINCKPEGTFLYDNDNFFISDKEKIMDSLKKLKSCNSIIDDDQDRDSTEVDKILQALGFLAFHRTLAYEHIS